MRVNWNKKYTTIAIYAVIVVILAISFYLSVMKFTKLSEISKSIINIMRPFIIGFSLAYLFNFIMRFYETRMILKINPNIRHRNKRVISMIMTYITVAILVTLFFKFVLPQVADSVSGIISDFPRIVNRLYHYSEKLVYNFDISDQARRAVNQRIIEFGRQAIDFVTNLVPFFANFFINVLTGIWNLVLGIIISIYILADKENFTAMCKRFVSAIFTQKKGERIFYVARLSNDIFGKFIVGKIIDSCIIAFITFIILYVTKMPYYILLTFIIGVTNVIPFFGPFIGAVPAILIVLFIDPVKALWLILIIFIIQQLDGNIIGPKILGGSIGISSFWILFSLLIAGKLLGLLGMIIGVPVFAIIHTLFNEYLNNKLDKKGLPLNKEDYK